MNQRMHIVCRWIVWFVSPALKRSFNTSIIYNICYTLSKFKVASIDDGDLGRSEQIGSGLLTNQASTESSA